MFLYISAEEPSSHVILKFHDILVIMELQDM
jgi:hypothetical protein